MAQKSDFDDTRPVSWRADQPYNNLPPLPPSVELETRPVLKQCIPARAALAELKQAAELIPNPAMLVDVIFEQPYCRIVNVVEAGISERQAASRYLKALATIGVLREQAVGREKLFVHPKLMAVLTRDDNDFESYPDEAHG